jgi:chromosomal replication initiator protein
LARHPKTNIFFTTTDQFITHYVQSVKNHTLDKLKERYALIDVLLLDDVQFLAGKKQTQEMLYTIFNRLHDTGKQIVLSSDRPPKELTNLEPRLCSRFESGIIVDIAAPDYELRLAILQYKAQTRGFLLPLPVAEYIASHAGSNVRELEGILNQLTADFDLRGKAPTVDEVAHRFKKLSVYHHAHTTLGKPNI